MSSKGLGAHSLVYTFVKLLASYSLRAERVEMAMMERGRTKMPATTHQELALSHWHSARCGDPLHAQAAATFSSLRHRTREMVAATRLPDKRGPANGRCTASICAFFNLNQRDYFLCIVIRRYRQATHPASACKPKLSRSRLVKRRDECGYEDLWHPVGTCSCACAFLILSSSSRHQDR